MADLVLWVEGVAMLYAAATTGLVVALLARLALRRGGRRPSAGEAAWCAFLPWVAVVLLPLVLGVQSHLFTPSPAMHDAWHQWAAVVHGSPWGHTSLHAANVLVVLLPLIGLARAIYFLARSRSFTAAIRALPSTSVGQLCGRPVFRIDAAQVTCFTLGAFRPAVFVTAALLDRLSPRDQEAALAHEAAHIRRRDELTRLLLNLFYRFLPLPGTRLLYRDWERAAERDCDAAAARAIGSRCAVAAALVQVAALARRPASPLPAGVSFRGDAEDVTERVETLLATTDDWGSAPCPALPVSLACACLLLVVASSSWVHHAVEAFTRH